MLARSGRHILLSKPLSGCPGSLQALVINGEPTGNVDFYKQEQSENRQKVIEDTFERSNEYYEQ